MVKIICDPEQREEIVEFLEELITEDELFQLSSFEPYIDTCDEGVMVDDQDEIFYSSGFYPYRDVPELFRRVKKQFPSIRMTGDYMIPDKYSTDYFIVEAGPKDKEVKFTEALECEVCGARIDKSAPPFIFGNYDYSICICSPECACIAVLEEDVYIDVFYGRLPEYAESVLTKDNVLPLLEKLEEERVQKELTDEEKLAAKAILLEYADRFGITGKGAGDMKV